MSECVSLIIWPTTANYSLISLWFYILCQKLQKCCNDIPALKRAYLYTHWFKSYELKSIRKPRRSTLLHLCNAKCHSYAVKCYITSNPKLPNIAMLLEPTVSAPSHCIAMEIIHLAKLLNRQRGSKNYALTMRWTAGHIGINGNKLVDKEAKKAAKGMSSKLE